MKTFQILFACLFLVAGVSQAQKSTVKTSTFKVWGNCGMCKTTIEGAAKNSGSTYASWDMEYAAAKTNDEKIQKNIANAGYDNVKYTAPDAAYDGLHECCKYDRKAADAKTDKAACCMKDGKCEGGKDCCKKMEGKSDCCATGKCAEQGGCCADMKCEKGEGCCKKEGAVAKADCCKGGTCSHK